MVHCDFVRFNLCPHSQLKSVSEKWKQASDKVDEEVGKLSQDAPDAVGKVTISRSPLLGLLAG